MRLEDARVLMVDDEKALRGIFAKWLSNAGCHSVRTAADGAEALTAIRREAVDLLITDVRMPGMDGLTLIRKLAQEERDKPAIILLSGFGDVDRRELLNLGVGTFLTKPFRLEELAAAIYHALAGRQIQAERRSEASRHDTLSPSSG